MVGYGRYGNVKIKHFKGLEDQENNPHAVHIGHELLKRRCAFVAEGVIARNTPQSGQTEGKYGHVDDIIVVKEVESPRQKKQG